MEGDMSAASSRMFPKASAETIADIDTLVSVAVFCGIGLLLSISVIILDQNLPGEWF
jgi:hypothetical protein